MKGTSCRVKFDFCFRHPDRASTDFDVGKRLWLRPGKKFLFGRTQQEEGMFRSVSLFSPRLMVAAAADGGFIVSDKTISRKHLTVEVENVLLSECVRVPVWEWNYSKLIDKRAMRALDHG
jgi:hypothetical protein